MVLRTRSVCRPISARKGRSNQSTPSPLQSSLVHALAASLNGSGLQFGLVSSPLRPLLSRYLSARDMACVCAWLPSPHPCHQLIHQHRVLQPQFRSPIDADRDALHFLPRRTADWHGPAGSSSRRPKKSRTTLATHHVPDGARDPKVNSLFQVADVATGVILWINADEVSDVIWSMDGWPTSTPIYEGH